MSISGQNDVLCSESIMKHPQHDNRDRRVSRTVQALRSSLFELVQEKHYDSITVQDIIDRANVGRSTFYTHFRDKEDLFVGDWKNFLSMIAEHIDLRHEGRIAPVAGLMTHLKDVHPYYRALVRSGKVDRRFSQGKEFLAEKIEEKITASGQQLSVPPAIVAHYLALQIFGLLKWWLDHNMPYTPEEMDKMFHTLVAPGIVNALKSSTNDDAKARAAPVHTPHGFHH